MQLVPAFVTASLLTGCSWIYNPNNISASNIDAPSDAEVILDADPSMLVVNGINPQMIYEGQGDGGSPAALIVLDGHNMVDANTTITLVPMAPLMDGMKMPTIGQPVIAKDGNWIAFPVTAPVDSKLPSSMQLVFDVQVSEDTLIPGTRSPTTHTMLTLQGLDELAPTGTSMDTKDLIYAKPLSLYSSVTLPATFSFTSAGADASDERAIIRATASITAQVLSATAGMAGGCAGGQPGQIGGCGGGGAGGTGTGGGGGAGCAKPGASGTGTGAGGMGASVGDELLMSYDVSTGSRSPGGGGGASTLAGLANGSAGGAGGALIELTAGGDVSVGKITVNGGDGGSGSIGGGGGGGAGGLVMLRAGRMLTTGDISVSGGKGNQGGGNGAGGRVRWDALMSSAPNVTAPAQGAAGSLHRGPSFVLDSYIFRDARATIVVQGTMNDKFQIYTINYPAGGGPPQTLNGSQTYSIGLDNSVTLMPTLAQGLSQLCLTLAGGVQGSSEADKCVYVAFLP